MGTQTMTTAAANGKREGWRMRQERIGQRLEVGHALLLP